MTYLEKVFAEQPEKVKELFAESRCPADFDLDNDVLNCAWPCDPDACKKCWNREVVESEDVCGK